MSSESTLKDFISLFRGRGDVYGSWEGGCIKKPLTEESFHRHLTGDSLIGVYPILPYKGTWWTGWGCSDIDVDDLDAARNLQTAFTFKGVTSWVEKTRKGYHVWVFADGLVHASTMRRAFLAAHQAIKYPAKEVNPKQESAGSGYGNYVRLPYPGGYHRQPENRYMLDDNDNYMPLNDFLQQALASRTMMEQLESLASMWKPPTQVHINDLDTTVDLRKILHRVGAIPYIIWRDGPIEGSDRSSTLFRLACKVRDVGLTPGEALAVVRSADQRWGKFHTRTDGERELTKIIERCYNVTTEEITQ